MRSFVCVLLSVAMTLVASIARADGRRIVLVGADETYTSAVFASLAAWDAEVVSVPSPPPTSGDDVAWGRAIASKHGADAVSWIRPAPPRGELVIFDVDSARVFHREIDRLPPFDDASAAAVALTIKSVLRTTRIAPVAERTPPPPSTTPPPERPTIAVRLEADGGVARSLAGSLEGRGALGLSLWPNETFGVALRLAGGPGAKVDTSELDATLVDLSFGLGPRARFASGPLGLEVGAGGSLHAVRLGGTLLRHAAEVSVPRVDPALDTSVVIEWNAVRDRLRVGVRTGLAFLLRSQRFLVGGVETLDLAPVILDGGLRITVRLD